MDELAKIPVELCKPKPGTMQARLFSNYHIKLPVTLFYDIEIPLEPFDSGLDYEKQPCKTSFNLNFIKFPVRDWQDFAGQEFELTQDDSEGGIYVGDHSPVYINSIKFERLSSFWFKIDCKLFCDFEYENVGQSETIELSAEIEFKGLQVNKDILEPFAPDDLANIQQIIDKFVSPDVYESQPQDRSHFWWFPTKLNP